MVAQGQNPTFPNCGKMVPTGPGGPRVSKLGTQNTIDIRSEGYGGVPSTLLLKTRGQHSVLRVVFLSSLHCYCQVLNVDRNHSPRRIILGEKKRGPRDQPVPLL
jgi:hypothetical protein